MPPESSSIPEPVRLRAVRSRRAPPEAAASAALGTLPKPLTSLVGREVEVATVVTLLTDRDCRLLTLTGPGGVGKTRLALAAATMVAATGADEVALIELAPVRDSALVPAAVAAAVGVQDLGPRPLRERLLLALGGRDLLLVIDNFEHVLPAATLVADLLANCPRLHVLASSRAPLALAGERICPVQPLALAPSGQHGPDVGPAVMLFVERAQAVAPDFRLTDANTAIVFEICRHLDGLPLAIELAAARTRILQPAALLTRLDRRLSFLTGGTRDQPHRLRTMEDTIAWSYDLLSPAEQSLFQRLAVFVNGFTLEAAEWVASFGALVSGTGGQIDSSVLDLITSLVDHSLNMRGIGGDGASRFSMLETIREYGLERLGASGEEAGVRDAHAHFCLAFAERYAPDFFRDDDVVLRFAAIAGEHANMLAALAHLAAAKMDGEQVRLAALLGPFWFLGSFHSVGRASLVRALANPTLLPAVEAMALANLGRLETFQGDHLAAAVTLERAVERATASGDPVALALARTGQAILAVFAGDYAEAQERGAEAEVLARSGHDPLAAAFARFVQARAVHYGGDLERAEALYRELLLDPPPRYAETTYHYSLAMIARARGEHQEALTLYAASLPLFLDLG
jgi:predicted ATPase